MASIYNFEVKCDNCGEVAQPEPPQSRLKWILGMTIVFGIIGAIPGLVVGVATAGVGFAAWIFTIPIGLYIGYRVGQVGAEMMNGPSCPGCDSTYDVGGFLPF